MTSSKNTGHVRLVTAPRIVSVPVSNSAAVNDAATTTLPSNAPASAPIAPTRGKRQSRPRPARRTANPIRNACTTVIHGNTRPSAVDNMAHAALNTTMTIRLAMIAPRNDCMRARRAPNWGSGGPLPSGECRFGSRSTCLPCSAVIDIGGSRQVGMLDCRTRCNQRYRSRMS